VAGVVASIGAGTIATVLDVSSLVGGIVVPPAAPILLAAGGCVTAVGSVVLLFKTLFVNHQFKALGHLKNIIIHIDKLRAANMGLYDDMNRSEGGLSAILLNTESVKENLKNGNLEFRKMSVDLCKEAIDSTNEMIECIDCINNIDLSKWIGDKSLKPSSTVVQSMKSITN
jgi:hypothetical protein